MSSKDKLSETNTRNETEQTDKMLRHALNQWDIVFLVVGA